VLTPEASLRLIMQDQGWNGGTPAEFKAARSAAKKIRRKSKEYGIWKFRDDSTEGLEIIDALEANKEQIRKRAKRIRSKRHKVISTDDKPIMLTDDDGSDVAYLSQRSDTSPEPPSSPATMDFTPKAGILVAASSASVNNHETPTPSRTMSSQLDDGMDEIYARALDKYESGVPAR
jgi:hypothetical protein